MKREARPGLWLEEVPEIGINDVLIRVDRTGICGTDLHIYNNGDAWARKTISVPMTVGHKFVGEIVAIGANVHDFFAGDIVSGEGHIVCGRCHPRRSASPLQGRAGHGREPAGPTAPVDFSCDEERLAVLISYAVDGEGRWVTADELATSWASSSGYRSRLSPRNGVRKTSPGIREEPPVLLISRRHQAVMTSPWGSPPQRRRRRTVGRGFR